MPRLIKKSSRKTGLPPGALVHIGERKTEKVRISIIDYNKEKFQEKEAKNIQQTVEGAVKDFEPAFRYKEFGDSNINFITILRVECHVTP